MTEFIAASIVCLFVSLVLGYLIRRAYYYKLWWVFVLLFLTCLFMIGGLIMVLFFCFTIMPAEIGIP